MIKNHLQKKYLKIFHVKIYDYLACEAKMSH
jgi:hypothetical protein